jgi:hypothetical protein
MISKSLKQALEKNIKKLEQVEPDLEPNSREILAAKAVLKNQPAAFDPTNSDDLLIHALANIS